MALKKKKHHHRRELLSDDEVRSIANDYITAIESAFNFRGRRFISFEDAN